MTQNELLAGVLLLACIFLLYCAYKKRSCPEGASNRIPGLHWRSGMSVPGLRWGASRNSLLVANARSGMEGLEGLEGLDGVRNKSLNDLVNEGVNHDVVRSSRDPYRGSYNPYFRSVEGVVDSRWSTDMNAQIPNGELTPEDIANGRATFGSEQADDLGWNVADCAKIPPPRSAQVLINTDYTPEYSAAKGSVTL